MKYLLLVLLMSALSACVSSQRIGESTEVWVADTTNVLGTFYNTDYYCCRSHKSEDGRTVEPKCFKATKLDSWTDSDIPLDISTKKK